MFKSDHIAEIFRGMIALKRSLMFRMPDGAAPMITPSQWMALNAIGDGAHTVKDVAETLKVSSSAATQLVDGLVKAGYVIRAQSKEDKREVALTLTSNSTDRIRQVRDYKKAQFEKVFSALTEKELETFAQLMKKLSASLTN